MPVFEPSSEGSWIDVAVSAAAGRDHEFVASPFAVEVARLEREHGAVRRPAFLRGVFCTP